MRATSSEMKKPWKVARDKRRSKAHRARRRDAHLDGVFPLAPALAMRHLHDETAPCTTDFLASEMPHDKFGYQGVHEGGRPKRLWDLKELIGEGSRWGFDLMRWDGR